MFSVFKAHSTSAKAKLRRYGLDELDFLVYYRQIGLGSFVLLKLIFDVFILLCLFTGQHDVTETKSSLQTNAVKMTNKSKSCFIWIRVHESRVLDRSINSYKIMYQSDNPHVSWYTASSYLHKLGNSETKLLTT